MNHPRLATDLARLKERRDQGACADAAYVSAWFLSWQMHCHGTRFASRTRKDMPRPDVDAWRERLLHDTGTALEDFLIGVLSGYRFFRVVPNATLALLGWLRDAWPLRLITRVPSPREVLAMQARGQRVVTLMDLPRAARPVLTKANGLDFMLHDLEHAWKFCHDARQYRLQRRFFGWLEAALEAGLFARYLGDGVFAGRFDYLISDMNTHPVHALCYFRAVLIECLLRRERKGADEWLSPASQFELGELMRDLGAREAWPDCAVQALIRLAEGRFSPTLDGLAIELALEPSAAGAGLPVPSRGMLRPR